MSTTPEPINPRGGGSIVVLMIGVIAFAVCAGIVLVNTGCTYNRNAPLISGSSINPIQIDTKLIVKDSANGNTVPVSAVP